MSEFILGNGLHFIVLERDAAPVVSCHTFVNVGAFDEEYGRTGIAHLLEHMAFKGTERIGSRNYKVEAPLLEAMDEVFYTLKEARAAGADHEVQQLTQQLKRLQEETAQVVVPNAFGALLQKQGAVGLNAATSHDATRYFVSLPSNKLELWFALESERFQAPVFRELYSEKQVVAEEKRMRIDNSPMGSFQAAFLDAALSNNYRRPVIGYSEDVEALGRREVADFHSQYYGPANMTIALVGDIRADQAYKLAYKYFNSWRPQNYTRLSYSAEAAAEEPVPSPQVPQDQWFYQQQSKAGPAALLAFYTPPLPSRDGIALEVASDILSSGRASRLISRLVQTEAALACSMQTGYPGDKHRGLSVVYGVPRPGGSLQSMEQLLQQQLEELASTAPTPAEMDRVRKSARAAVLASAQSNAGMASALCNYQVMTGSWRGLLRELEVVENMTGEDVRVAVERLLSPQNCFRGYVLREA